MLFYNWLKKNIYFNTPLLALCPTYIILINRVRFFRGDLSKTLWRYDTRNCLSSISIWITPHELQPLH
jgi:hypothetical protein